MQVDGGASKRSQRKYIAWPEKATAAPTQPGCVEKFKLAGSSKTSEKDNTCQTCPCVFWSFFYHRGFQCLFRWSSVICREEKCIWQGISSMEEADDPREPKKERE